VDGSAGDAFEVWVAPGDESPWYVNLQEPLRRVGAGFVTMDQVLDILVGRDLTWWRWKDEDEFDYARRTGFFTPARAAEIRETGDRIIKAVEAGRPPWDPSWATWSPPGAPPWFASAQSEAAVERLPRHGGGDGVDRVDGEAGLVTE
jgi:Protein of unknown function (DUF402)